jgi:hypothetical protein
MIYNVGDIVVLKTKEQLLGEGWELDYEGDLSLPEIQIPVIIPHMFSLLGTKGTIVQKSIAIEDTGRTYYDYKIKEDSEEYTWADNMFYLPVEIIINNIKEELSL